MAKILFISNIGKRVGSFSEASISAAKKLSHEFYYAANWDAATPEQREEDEAKYGIKLVHIDLSRSPYSPRNIKAYKQLVEFINKEKIDYIHCNTPVGGMLGRIAGQKCNVKKVIYQVHGFHFFKGAPLKNWLLYYPIEKLLAYMTDASITINREDYERVKSFHLRNHGKGYYVPGVGIDTSCYGINNVQKRNIRDSIGLSVNDFVILVVGRLEKNKNCYTIVDSVAQLTGKNIKIVFCGEGPEREGLEVHGKKLCIDDALVFLGNRSDMPKMYCMADCMALASFREGLSRTIMEAMASGLPCVVSRIRGNVDLIDPNGGFLCDPQKVEDFAEAINRLLESEELRKKMGQYNKKKISHFDIATVTSSIADIYSEVFDRG